jgi:heme oxygenase
MIAAHAILREATAEKHAEVDMAFARFDLGDRAAYVSFLRAHARTLAAIELVLAEAPDGFPAFRTRLDCLAADLAAMAMPWPRAMALDTHFSPAALLGMRYVAEGSRLGGGILAARVSPSMPSAYLGAVHLKGEWRALLMALDAVALDQPQAWHDEMVNGARRTFDLFIQSAALEALALAD